MYFYSGYGSKLFSEFIKPEHTLIFQYPTRGLPNQDFYPNGLGQIYANRKNKTDLADKSNPPDSCLLQIGDERHDITVRP